MEFITSIFVLLIGAVMSVLPFILAGYVGMKLKGMFRGKK